MSEDICKNCRYFDAIADDRSLGKCRRYPPYVLWDVNVANEETCWPVVMDEAWCGEFKSRQSPFAVEGPRG